MSSEAVGRNPLSIVKEYLGDHEPRVRTNAAVALAAIASRESLAELVKLALEDQDAKVRETAVREIKGLSEDDRSYCVDLVIDDLDEPGLQRQASSLLADLRNEGVPIRPLRLSFLDSLRLSTRSRSGPAHGRRSLWRVLSASALGGFLGAVILLVALEALGSTDRKVQGFLLVTTLAASGLLGATAAQFCRPLSAYLDRRWGAAVEMGAVFLGTLLPLLALVLPYLLFWSLQRDVPLQKLGSALLGGIIGAALFSGAVRGGTMIGAASAFQRPWQRFIAQVLVGSAAGLLALSGLFLWTAVALQKDGNYALAEFAVGWWLLLLPCGMGLAASIAVADPGARGRGFKQRLSAVTVSVLLVAAAVGLSWLHLSKDRRGDLPFGERLTHSKTLDWGPFKDLPISGTLRLDFAQVVSIQTIVPEDFTAQKKIDLMLLAWQEAKSIGTEDNEPPTLELNLQEPGEYRVELRDDDTLDDFEPIEETLRTSYFAVAGRLAHLDLAEKAGDDDPGIRLQIVLNSTPSIALHEAVQGLLERGEVQEALGAFERAARLDPAIRTSLLTLDKLCRLGSLKGHAELVLKRCDRAAAIAPTGFILESRGIARALAKDYAGAAEDFRKVAAEAADKGIQKSRTHWADELDRNRETFSPEKVAELLKTTELLRTSKNRRLKNHDKRALAQRGLNLLMEGRFNRGTELLDLVLDNVRPYDFKEDLCWYSALRPEGKDPRQIAQICQKNSYVLDELGLGMALARAQDWEGAAAMVDRFSSSAKEDEDEKIRALAERGAQWKERLQSHNDPFTSEERARIEEVLPVPDMKEIEERMLAPFQEEEDKG